MHNHMLGVSCSGQTSLRHLLLKPSPVCELFEPCFLSSVGGWWLGHRQSWWRMSQKHRWSSQIGKTSNKNIHPPRQQRSPKPGHVKTLKMWLLFLILSNVLLPWMIRHKSCASRQYIRASTGVATDFTHLQLSHSEPRTPGPPTLTWREASTILLRERKNTHITVGDSWLFMNSFKRI